MTSGNTQSLSPFDFHGNAVRVHIDEHGAPWFIAKDVCECLGISNPRDALTRLDDSQKGVAQTDTLGGAQKVRTVSESGLYRLVMRSDRPEAAVFQKWVTDEVLPTIRKTGSYGAVPETPEMKLLAGVLWLQEKCETQERQLAAQAHQLAIAGPKVEFADAFMDSDGLFGLQNAARCLGCKPAWFIAELEQRFLFRQGTHLVPRSKYIENGFFAVKTTVIGKQSFPQSFLTPKGLYHVAKVLGLAQLGLPGVD